MKERQIGIDVIKTLAITFVVGGHFFINTEFFNHVSGLQFVTLSVARRLFSISVPLFLLCTGYLSLGKQPTKSYYLGGMRVIYSYLLISAVTIAYEVCVNHVELSVTEWLLKVTDFKAIAYGWYIEMWIGLFLMAPFMNLMWGAMTDKQRKIWLLTLLMLTAVPAFVNRPGFGLLPDFWQMSYPLLFYFIGGYIRHYQPSYNRYALSILLLLVCSINPVVNLLVNHVGTMNPGNPFGLIGGVLSTLLFLICYRCDLSASWLKKSVVTVSIFSLDMYLISYLFDDFFYRHTGIATNQKPLAAFALVIPSVLLLSYAFAYAKAKLFKFAKISK